LNLLYFQEQLRKNLTEELKTNPANQTLPEQNRTGADDILASSNYHTTRGGSHQPTSEVMEESAKAASSIVSTSEVNAVYISPGGEVESSTLLTDNTTTIGEAAAGTVSFIFTSLFGTLISKKGSLRLQYM
jgi:hypothetical protein